MKDPVKFRDLMGDLCHVRGKVDGYTVYRRWSRLKKRWSYNIMSPFEFALCLKENRKPWLGVPNYP